MPAVGEEDSHCWLMEENVCKQGKASHAPALVQRQWFCAVRTSNVSWEVLRAAVSQTVLPPSPDLLNQKLWVWGSALEAFPSSPGESDVWSNLEPLLEGSCAPSHC